MLFELILVVESIVGIAWPELWPWRSLEVRVMTACCGLGMLVGWYCILRNLTGRGWPVLVPLWGDALMLRQLGYTSWWCLPAWLLPPMCGVMRFVVPIALVSRYRLSTAMLACVVLVPWVGLILLALQTRHVALTPRVHRRRVALVHTAQT